MDIGELMGGSGIPSMPGGGGASGIMMLFQELGSGMIVALILALLGAAAILIFVIPDKFGSKMKGFLGKIRDFFLVKNFWVEVFFKYLFAFQTLFCIFLGIVFIVLSFKEELQGSGVLWIGLMLIVIGPVFSRISYETVRLIFNTYYNIKAIREKLDQGVSVSVPAVYPSVETEHNSVEEKTGEEPQPKTALICPHCGKENLLDSVFCEHCGTKLTE